MKKQKPLLWIDILLKVFKINFWTQYKLLISLNNKFFFFEYSNYFFLENVLNLKNLNQFSKLFHTYDNV